MDKDKAPNCYHCKHYFVTWDQSASKGCKLYNIKSSQMPSHIAFQASGHHCQGFEEKKAKTKKKESSVGDW